MDAMINKKDIQGYFFVISRIPLHVSLHI